MLQEIKDSERKYKKKINICKYVVEGKRWEGLSLPSNGT